MVMSMSDGHKVFLRLYKPIQPAIGNIHILHGMAEHSGRYDEFASLLCKKGYFVTVHDHRGHGKTAELQGELGHIANENGFNLIVQDSFELIDYFRDPSRPTILFGHSMGSFIARRLIQRQSEVIDGCILCGTSNTTFRHTIGNRLANMFARLQGKNIKSKQMNRLFFGTFNSRIENPKTPFDWLTSNTEEIEKYMTDPYCGFIPSYQFFVDLTDGLLSIDSKKQNNQIRKDLPIFLISGTEDPVGSYGKGVFDVAKGFETVKIKDVTVHLFEQMRHELLNERNKELVYNVILRWLEKHDNR